MSSSPEFPNNDINTKGAHAGNPNLPEDMRETPAVEYNRPLDQAAQNDITIPNTYEEGWKNAPLSDEEIAAAQARLNPEKKKTSLGVKIGVAAASLLALAGIAKGVSDGVTGGGKINMPPASEPTAEAPVVPGPAVPAETVAPSPEASAKYTLVNESNVENYIKDYDALVESNKLTVGEYPGIKEVFPAMVGKINELINIELTDEELKASETLMTEDGKTGPEALAAMKRDAYDDLFPDASFKAQLDKISEDNFKWYLKTRDDESPFKATFVDMGTSNITEHKYINNAGKGNSLNPVANADVFVFAAANPKLGSVPQESGDPSQRTWDLGTGIRLVKQGTTANQ